VSVGLAPKAASLQNINNFANPIHEGLQFWLEGGLANYAILALERPALVS
jgi:hypothetical protein